MKEVYSLLVEIGRIEGDDLPEGATGAAMLIFAPAKEEKLAVSDTVQLLRDAGLSPLEVTNYGTVKEREDDGYEFSDEEKALIDEALNEGSVIILDKTVFYDDGDQGVRH